MSEGDKQRLLASMRARIQQIESRPKPAIWLRAPILPPEEPRLASALPGARSSSPHGEVRVQERLLEPEHHHGAVEVQRALAIPPGLLSKLCLEPALEHIDLRRMLLLDTESTHLSGARGDLPFLIGLGWFEAESLNLHQLFLERLDDEPAMLLCLRDLVERASCIVTYNGKSYDWPLILGRYAEQGIEPPRPRPHADLLHAVRRVFSSRMGSVRLVEVEEQVLKMHRERDIRGAEIPGVYWSFMRHKVGTAIAPVIEHNANDIVALAAIMAELAARFSQPQQQDDPRDHLSMAKLAVRAQDPARAQRFAQAALDGEGAPWVSVEAGLLLFELLKKQGSFQKAERALVRALEHPVHDELLDRVRLALSKLYEHKLKDLPAALKYAQALVLAPEPKRVERLEARIERAEAKALKRRKRKG